MPSLGVVIYTHSRTDDAKINIELVQRWNSNYLNNIEIVHSYNGKPDWYSHTSEDFLLKRPNLGHTEGAVDIIDAGIKELLYKKNYILVLAADTWILRTDYLDHVVKEMTTNGLYIATSSWGSNKYNNIWVEGFATDFFIIDCSFSASYELFPMNYRDFCIDHPEIQDDFKHSTVEKLFTFRFLQALERKYTTLPQLGFAFAEQKIYRMKEREPIHKEDDNGRFRKMYFKNIELLTHHEPVRKREILKDLLDNKEIGKYTAKFLNSEELDYYNETIWRNKLELDMDKINKFIKHYTSIENTEVYIEHAVDYGQYYLRAEDSNTGETHDEIALGEHIPDEIKGLNLPVQNLH